jgi:RNA polymerase sigma factor (TIGR02999 family)
VSAHVDLTALIHRAQKGDAEAVDALFAESYPVLQRIARARLRAHARTPTLDTGSLVHEAYLRFVGSGRLRIEDRVHFHRWVGRVMRSVIIDMARKRLAERRGGGATRVSLTSDLPVPASGGEDLVLRVHEALSAFPERDRTRGRRGPRHHRPHRAPRLGEGAAAAGRHARVGAATTRAPSWNA